MPTTSSDVRSKILVGTASWSDPGFVERWYPKRMPASERLAWYAGHFEMVEVNSTFYSVPEPRLVERWCSSTPPSFIFNVKLHKLLSRHSATQKLLPPALQRIAEIDRMGKAKLTPQLEEVITREILRSIQPLRASGKLGALLLQLSPEFSPNKYNLGELDGLLASLDGYRVAIEFRNRHWVQDDQLAATLQFLRRHCATLVSVDAPTEDHFTIMPPDLDEITNPQLAYLRLHGRNAKAYLRGKTVAARFDYDYSEEEIAEVAERSRKLARQAKELQVVFNNNNLDYAPRAASRLRIALGQIVRRVPQQAELFGKSGGVA